jgi:hypothetical protein
MGYLIDILIGAAGSLLAAELWSQSDAVARWLIQKAVGRLPVDDRERRREEWLADLVDMPGAFRKLLWALGCHWAATVARKQAAKSRGTAAGGHEPHVLIATINEAAITVRPANRLQRALRWCLFASGVLMGAGFALTSYGALGFGSFFMGAGFGAGSYAYYRYRRASRRN